MAQVSDAAANNRPARTATPVIMRAWTLFPPPPPGPLLVLSSDTLATAPPVSMFTAPNPGPKTLDGTHTYVAGHDHAYLIDPGPDLAGYQEALAGWLRQGGYQVEGILLTHGHPDHATGAKRLQRLISAPIWASLQIPEERASELGVELRCADGDAFGVDGDVLRVRAAPGHTADHVVFWLEGARILFGGDNVLGQGTSVIAPPEGDMRDYLRTLQMLRALRPALLAPGHGPVVTDPEGKIAEYIAHRRRREEQILAALQRGPSTVGELVQQVYRDLDPRLRELAAASTQAQLDKLTAEGQVVRRGDAYHRTARSLPNSPPSGEERSKPAAGADGPSSPSLWRNEGREE